MGEGECREREKGKSIDVRGKHQSVTFRTHPDSGWDPQPGYLPWPSSIQNDAPINWRLVKIQKWSNDNSCHLLSVSCVPDTGLGEVCKIDTVSFLRNLTASWAKTGSISQGREIHVFIRKTTSAAEEHWKLWKDLHTELDPDGSTEKVTLRKQHFHLWAKDSGD